MFVSVPSQVNAFAPSGLFVPSHWKSATAVHEAPASSEADRLRESAEKLRKEVEDLQAELRSKPVADTKEDNGGGVNAKTAKSSTSTVTYSSLKDSVWTLTYRFASDPPPQDGDKDQDRVVSTYSGKMKVRFRPDGYTDFVSHDPTGETRVQMAKVWGWDEEKSAEDGQRYLLFSTNVQLPPTDLSLPNESLRCYWQARLERSKDNTISLADGTVTVKKDVEPPGGFWGVFNAGGILAQFRYVGDFLIKPDEL